MDRRNPHVASALRKLGISLEKLAPLISHFVRNSANTFDDDSKRQDPLYLQVLEKLTLAWAEKRQVQLWYRGAERKQVKEYTFCPYFVEVSAVGQAVYAIGIIQPQNQTRTFKIERVERIELLKEHYAIPADFNPNEMLGQAWGIWFTDEEPLEIKLRFSARVAARVRETRWHPSEQVSELEDGSLLWCASIAEPREMLPWVRGWGADVEVLEPQELRETIKTEAKNLAMIYQMKIAEE
jgi:predicted DNA-binding transcriptional regulator YafY